jgi:hypothetical protein
MSPAAAKWEPEFCGRPSNYRMLDCGALIGVRIRATGLLNEHGKRAQLRRGRPGAALPNSITAILGPVKGRIMRSRYVKSPAIAAFRRFG